MASQDVKTKSRLAEMRMKFQRKQMEEREQKKLVLAGVDLSETLNNTAGNGKVRQMFDDRRRGVGIDRSHPLRPIATSTTSTIGAAKATTQKLPVGGVSNVPRRPPIANKPIQNRTNTNRSNSNNNSPKTNGNVGNIFPHNFDEVDNIDNETFPSEFSSLSLSNTHVMGSYDYENNGNEENNVLGGTVILNKKTAPKSNGIKLNPVITKKSLSRAASTETRTRRTSSSNSKPLSLSKTVSSFIRSPVNSSSSSPGAKSIKASGNKTSSPKPATFTMSVKPPPRISSPPPGMVSCAYCQRHFNKDRLAKHEEVCAKMMSKKRKVFDASKHRVKGTDAEKYLKKRANSTTSKGSSGATHTAKPVNSLSSEKKSNWRQKHEEFITAIREAKKVQAHLAKGGKLSDLPPPPPSENPDYIQCPHCSRRFNESAAERHIPKCATMQHNKPKPPRKRL